MKKHFLSAVCIAAIGLLLGTPIFAQDKKEKDKEKEKKSDYDQIIIKKKTDKDSKVTIEMKDGEVLVNGKPIDEYDDENLSIRKQKIPRMGGNQFRNGYWNQDNFNENYVEAGGNKAFLGVVTDEDDKGARITNVTDGSAAEKAGLKEDDVITKIDDKKIENHEDLTKAIGKYKPEDKVTVTYLRDGKESKVTATLGKNKTVYSYSSPRVQVMPRIETMPDMNFNFDWDGDHGDVFALAGHPRIGIKAQDTEDGKGAKVLDVKDESPADKAGIKEDDIITEFDGKTINSADDLAEAANNAREKEKSSMPVKLTREGKSQSVEIKIPKKLKTANL